MKRIYFIRHAKSDHDTGLLDHDRPLNKRGKKDAPFMAKRLRQFAPLPDVIISSSADRALTTANLIARVLGIHEIKIEPRLYMSNEITYLDVIRELPDSAGVVFLIGHNPVITTLCESLSGEFIGNIPTCGILAIDFEVESWAQITVDCGDKVVFDYPSKHKLG
jgi:phosphohistidine phosphatase